MKQTKAFEIPFRCFCFKHLEFKQFLSLKLYISKTKQWKCHLNAQLKVEENKKVSIRTLFSKYMQPVMNFFLGRIDPDEGLGLWLGVGLIHNRFPEFSCVCSSLPSQEIGQLRGTNVKHIGV